MLARIRQKPVPVVVVMTMMMVVMPVMTHLCLHIRR